MAKSKSSTHYVCQGCGTSSAKWLGRCPGCGEWNTYVEEIKNPSAPGEGSLSEFRQNLRSGNVPGEALSLSALSGKNAEKQFRFSTGQDDLDRLLGGGLVRDSFILIGGDPGIGKSTLLLQLADSICEKEKSLKVLYVTGEESIEQVRSRASRLNVKSKDQIHLASETELERALELVKVVEPEILIMDSLQTFSTNNIESSPGSVGQIREVTARLMTLAKTKGMSVWMVGHVTKEGAIAGPKMVEHMVDTVLYFEGESTLNYRILRSVKNRFGSTREIVVFEMQGIGLELVKNPSSLFLTERNTSVSGTAIGCTIEGTRSILVELQALATKSHLSMPRRTSVGIDSNRLALLAAIIEKHSRVNLFEYDLFFNVSGGLKLNDPACDLAAIAAVLSSTIDRPIPVGTLLLGEVSLTGEVRPVNQLDLRLEEAERLGFQRALIPMPAKKSQVPTDIGIELTRIRHVSELMEWMKSSKATVRQPSATL